jgi:hypothetical protein
MHVRRVVQYSHHSRPSRLPFVFVSLSVIACSDVVSMIGDLSGSTGDVYCDRRYVTPGKAKAPEAFCQEVIDTIAVSEISDDCRKKHAAKSNSGKCPRDHVIGGCKLDKINEDGSKVWDWYYDVSGMAGGFKSAIRTKDQVRAVCADRHRYEDGASFADP